MFQRRPHALPSQSRNTPRHFHARYFVRARSERVPRDRERPVSVRIFDAGETAPCRASNSRVCCFFLGFRAYQFAHLLRRGDGHGCARSPTTSRVCDFALWSCLTEFPSANAVGFAAYHAPNCGLPPSIATPPLRERAWPRTTACTEQSGNTRKQSQKRTTSNR